MALPFLLPLLFTAGSVAANTIGANQQKRATNATLAAERARQNQFNEQAFAVSDRARDRYADMGEKQSAKASDLASLYTSALDSAPSEPVVALPATESGVVTSRIESENAKTRDASERRAEARGRFESFGDVFGDASLGTARDAGELGMIGSFRRGSNSVLPLELEAAAQKGAGLRMLGDLFNLGAGITMPGALMAGGGRSLTLGELFGGNSWGIPK